MASQRVHRSPPNQALQLTGLRRAESTRGSVWWALRVGSNGGPAAERPVRLAAHPERMLEDVDILLAIAEIAGVFVGFAALVTVVAGRSQTESRYDDTFRLLHVVITSAQVIAAALVPVVLLRYGLSQSTVWRVSSGLVFALNWIVILFINRVTQGYSSAHTRMRAVSVTSWSLEALYQGSLLLCIVGAWRGLAPAFYLTAIVVGVFQVIVIFTDLITSMLRRGRV